MSLAPLAPRLRLRLLDAVAGMHPVDAAVRCLALACPELDDPAGLPVGRRDTELLALRGRLLGDRLVARTTCADCGETLTSELSVAGLVARMGEGTPSGQAERWTVHHDGRAWAVRALTSRDLAGAAAEPDSGRARDLLVRAALDGQPVAGAEISAELAAEISASLAEHDPGSEVTLSGTCAACGREWTDLLDPAAYVTAELAHHGTRLLAEVAELARAFGWTEDDVLTLSDERRRSYLELAAEMVG